MGIPSIAVDEVSESVSWDEGSIAPFDSGARLCAINPSLNVNPVLFVPDDQISKAEWTAVDRSIQMIADPIGGKHAQLTVAT